MEGTVIVHHLRVFFFSFHRWVVIKKNCKQVAYLVRLGGAGTGLPLVFVARRIWTELLERLVITLLVPVVPDRL